MKRNEDYEQLIEKARDWRENLPVGHYAIEIYADDEDGTEIGHRVFRRTEPQLLASGRIRGRHRLLHSIRFHPEVPRETQWDFLAEDTPALREQALAFILQDLRRHSVAYGHLTGSCGVCGRRLTDPESVALGIGPVCLAKIGG